MVKYVYPFKSIGNEERSKFIKLKIYKIVDYAQPSGV
jgi:hypothetical protein